MVSLLRLVDIATAEVAFQLLEDTDQGLIIVSEGT